MYSRVDSPIIDDTSISKSASILPLTPVLLRLSGIQPRFFWLELSIYSLESIISNRIFL